MDIFCMFNTSSFLASRVFTEFKNWAFERPSVLCWNQVYKPGSPSFSIVLCKTSAVAPLSDLRWQTQDCSLQIKDKEYKSLIVCVVELTFDFGQ